MPKFEFLNRKTNDSPSNTDNPMTLKPINKELKYDFTVQRIRFSDRNGKFKPETCKFQISASGKTIRIYKENASQKLNYTPSEVLDVVLHGVKARQIKTGRHSDNIPKSHCFILEINTKYYPRYFVSEFASKIVKSVNSGADRWNKLLKNDIIEYFFLDALETNRDVEKSEKIKVDDLRQSLRNHGFQDTSFLSKLPDIKLGYPEFQKLRKEIFPVELFNSEFKSKLEAEDTQHVLKYLFYDTCAFISSFTKPSRIINFNKKSCFEMF